MHEIDTLRGIILPYVNFLIFLGLAIYFFRKPLSNLASKRREDFESAFAAAHKSREEANQKFREIESRFAQLDKEISGIKANAQVDAERDAKRVLEDATHLAAHLKEETRRIISAETEQAQEEIREKIVASLKDEVEKKLKKELGPEQHINLVKKRLNDLNQIRVGG